MKICIKEKDDMIEISLVGDISGHVEQHAKNYEINDEKRYRQKNIKISERV